MLSLIIQLIGCSLLSWNAITKKSSLRAFESQTKISKSIGVDLEAAFLKQKEYYLNIFGFIILSTGYVFPILFSDLQTRGIFSDYFLVTVFVFIFYLIRLLVDLIARKTAKSFVKLSNTPHKDSTYLHIGEFGNGHDISDFNKH